MLAYDVSVGSYALSHIGSNNGAILQGGPANLPLPGPSVPQPSSSDLSASAFSTDSSQHQLRRAARFRSSVAPLPAQQSDSNQPSTQECVAQEQSDIGGSGATCNGKRKADYPAENDGDNGEKRPRIYPREDQLVVNQPSSHADSEPTPPRWPPSRDILDFSALLLELGITEGHTAERFFYHLNNIRKGGEPERYPMSIRELAEVWEGAARALTAVCCVF